MAVGQAASVPLSRSQISWNKGLGWMEFAVSQNFQAMIPDHGSSCNDPKTAAKNGQPGCMANPPQREAQPERSRHPPWEDPFTINQAIDTPQRSADTPVRPTPKRGRGATSTETTSTPPASRPAPNNWPPLCLLCGQPMGRRIAGNSNRLFWG
jgi:hypothetical protein